MPARDRASYFVWLSLAFSYLGVCNLRMFAPYSKTNFFYFQRAWWGDVELRWVVVTWGFQVTRTQSNHLDSDCYRKPAPFCTNSNPGTFQFWTNRAVQQNAFKNRGFKKKILKRGSFLAEHTFNEERNRSRKNERAK